MEQETKKQNYKHVFRRRRCRLKATLNISNESNTHHQKFQLHLLFYKQRHVMMSVYFIYLIIYYNNWNNQERSSRRYVGGGFVKIFATKILFHVRNTEFFVLVFHRRHLYLRFGQKMMMIRRVVTTTCSYKNTEKFIMICKKCV